VIVIGRWTLGSKLICGGASWRGDRLITLNLDLVGQMSCNPAIGGIAKGIWCGRLMRWAESWARHRSYGIQFRLLNRSRGPAVQSPRAQADRMRYRAEMRRTLEATPNLHLRQGKCRLRHS
jgi:tRNA uridine 5-carboxymethylaminomethyl modification enzyme